MKQTIIILAFSVLFFSCSNKTAQSSHSKPDTIKTLLLYSMPGNVAKVELGFRIIKDSVKFVMTDNETQKKTLTKDTIYFVPYVDSARGLLFVPHPKELILVDGGKNIDSIFSKYKLHFPAADTTNKQTARK